MLFKLKTSSSFIIKQIYYLGVRTISSSSSRCRAVATDNGKQLATDINDENFKIGFIGVGKIAQSIIAGLLSQKKLRPSQIYASEANPAYLKYLKEQHPLFRENKINLLEDNSELLSKVRTVLLCIKPDEVVRALERHTNILSKNHLLISIAAGVCIQKIEDSLMHDVRVIRIMTNVAALALQGCSVYARGTFTDANDVKCVRTLLESIGTCEGEVNEDLLDVITGLSGSGPAYMFVILDALADGGVKMGLTRETALKMAAQTMFGSSLMVLEELKRSNPKHLLQLKEEVCSPSGSTIHGLAELEKNKLRYALIKCVESACQRSRELNNSDARP